MNYANQINISEIDKRFLPNMTIECKKINKINIRIWRGFLSENVLY